MRYSLVELAPVTPGHSKPEALQRSLDAAVEAEGLGYHRIWFAEHHNALGYAAQDPVSLIALAAARTERIHVGSGAVLLNHYSPYSVAERFLQLEALSPGRVDLGLGRANGGPAADLALKRDRRSPMQDDYAEQIQEILAYYHHAFDESHPFATLDPTHGIDGVPEVFSLGSSGSSAGLAGKLGIGYAFAGFINPGSAHAALSAYRDNFEATPFGSGEPQSILALNIVAAPTQEEAHRLTWPNRAMWSDLRDGKQGPVRLLADAEAHLTDEQKDAPSQVDGLALPQCLSGDPETLREQLQPIVTEFGVTEIMVQDALNDPELRSQSRALIAEGLGAIEA
ncbi:MAG TPA: MsnO8 family LLM class oxidoreductase [Candidatus Corynebacterium avicola]|uniref:MsnO8 family LLM class oxidoreductase n=1 Tax=Candidatus Corynebacterium avicola TaxID=2838527 RepID=A0A9D1UK55_9CORY|nr:MsnO8 family LLM class oxidoreductase [Candidatus Corynebacterium avicola]